MSAASSGSADPALSAAELAVLRQLDRGERWQTIDAIAAAAGLSRSAAAGAIRVLYYRHAYAVPLDPRDLNASWACSALGDARLRREPPALRLV